MVKQQFITYREEYCSSSTVKAAAKHAAKGYDAKSLDATGKVCIVTGVRQGSLGFEIARQMMHNGAKVYCAGRTESNVRASMKAMAEGAPANAVPTEFLEVDISSFARVRKAAESFLSRESVCHVLVNNAGGTDSPMTEDGFQGSFGTNYMGPFLLTQLLMPALRRGEGRIVHMSSQQHNPFCVPPTKADCTDAREELLQGIFVGGRRYLETPEAFPFHAFVRPLTDFPQEERSILGYGAAKFAMVAHAKELARREPGVIALAVDPGAVATSMMDWYEGARKANGWDNILTVQQGAAMPLFAALAPGLTSGGYWSDFELDKYDNPVCSDTVLGAKLFEWSLEAVGFRDQIQTSKL